ncbi:hypothetical protein KR084_009810 [Drosophila pseudotakahashii]|nr:hypothetical protein KR084_009810 [Drosophila pseudotakahashii]
MDVRQQMQDVNQDLELEEHAEDLSRNSSLTTVCSTFPLTSRIDSHHRWQSMEIGVEEGEAAEDIINRQLEMEGERKVQLAIAMPLAIEAIHP